MRYSIHLLTASIVFASCHSIVHKAEEVTSNTATGIGEQVGKRSSEFVSGVKDGVDKAYGCTVDLSPALQQKGVSLGKFVIDADTGGQNKNKLSVYIITTNPINQTVTAKVTDSKGLEYGRISVKVNTTAGAARFIDFIFDSRTDIEGRSKIVLE
ncbi:hypothetical protein CJD36_004605 [Flavipsychrobacter stenotrophus]|uniref:Uncharacterized protein n=1 Tax=Flavipsychrobacter stenotrophus TaxID=2077091 RepID=A0A2S7T1F4_9BACT|nr:hypothetical protein [Flavipsychrobacter stenotrophus]PQJ13030.1 hypothetical protein CJD36_004605 [Flavipsychrobacter stenotrophus]